MNQDYEQARKTAQRKKGHISIELTPKRQNYGNVDKSSSGNSKACIESSVQASKTHKEDKEGQVNETAHSLLSRTCEESSLQDKGKIHENDKMKLKEDIYDKFDNEYYSDSSQNVSLDSDSSDEYISEKTNQKKSFKKTKKKTKKKKQKSLKIKVSNNSNDKKNSKSQDSSNEKVIVKRELIQSHEPSYIELGNGQIIVQPLARDLYWRKYNSYFIRLDNQDISRVQVQPSSLLRLQDTRLLLEKKRLATSKKYIAVEEFIRTELADFILPRTAEFTYTYTQMYLFHAAFRTRTKRHDMDYDDFVKVFQNVVNYIYPSNELLVTRDSTVNMTFKNCLMEKRMSDYLFAKPQFAIMFIDFEVVTGTFSYFLSHWPLCPQTGNRYYVQEAAITVLYSNNCIGPEFHYYNDQCVVYNVPESISRQSKTNLHQVSLTQIPAEIYKVYFDDNEKQVLDQQRQCEELQTRHDIDFIDKMGRFITNFVSEVKMPVAYMAKDPRLEEEVVESFAKAYPEVPMTAAFRTMISNFDDCDKFLGYSIGQLKHEKYEVDSCNYGAHRMQASIYNDKRNFHCALLDCRNMLRNVRDRKRGQKDGY